jgi:hypothetical protein
MPNGANILKQLIFNDFYKFKCVFDGDNESEGIDQLRQGDAADITCLSYLFEMVAFFEAGLFDAGLRHFDAPLI